MPYTQDYIDRANRLERRIYATRSTPRTAYGRHWLGVVNRLRTRLAYALPRA
jgi:hypothetical protein